MTQNELTHSDDLAVQIINVVFRYRRSLQDAHEYRHYCEQCNVPHLERIRSYMARNEPVRFVLPAFPAKSPNLNKVLGRLPDKGEELALDFLGGLCREIKSLYAPGADLVICSDGHVFADVVRVEDGDIDAYNRGITSLIAERGLPEITTFGLSDVLGDIGFEAKRKELVHKHAYSPDEIRALIKTSPRELVMFNGIEKFMIEDIGFLEPTKSKSAIRKLCHELTYTVIQRSHAWSALVEANFPEAIRLSIHPQPCHFQKLGVYLIESKNNWLTPWHGVAVKIGDKFELMKKYEALSIGAKIIEENGKPSYLSVQ